MSNSSPATTSLRSLCSGSCPTVRVYGMLFSRHRPTLGKRSILGLARRLRKAICPKPTAGAITASSRSSPIRSSTRRGPAGPMTSSGLEATYTPLTQRPSSFALRHSSGRCIGRTRAREASRSIRCMTSRPRSRPSSI